MKNLAVLKISDVSVEEINVYETVMAKIKREQQRMEEEMEEMNRILDSAN